MSAFDNPPGCRTLDTDKAIRHIYIMVENTVKELWDAIRAARHCVALTGAGVSTLSGIRDFRGPGGLYTLDNGDYQRMFDIEWFERDSSIYYNAARDFIYGLDEKSASIVHTTLGKMEARGLVKAIITQNIDLLHQKGGAKRVIEVHGSAQTHYCLRCAGVRMSFEEVRGIVLAGEMPKCPRCGRVLKPAITFFGEALPFDALRNAEAEAEAADLMLVLGTSLTVYPAAGLPSTCLRWGGKLVVVNNQETPLDSAASLHYTDLGAVFTELSALMESGEKK